MYQSGADDTYNKRLAAQRRTPPRTEPAPVDTDYDTRLHLVRLGKGDAASWNATQRAAKRS